MAPGRRAASVGLAAVLAVAFVAAASAVVAPTVTSLASGASPGTAGTPTFRTLYLSYVSNWQFSTAGTFNGVPLLSNNNFYVLRAFPVEAALCVRSVCRAHNANSLFSGFRRGVQPHLQHGLAGWLQRALRRRSHRPGGRRRRLVPGHRRAVPLRNHARGASRCCRTLPPPTGNAPGDEGALAGAVAAATPGTRTLLQPLP